MQRSWPTRQARRARLRAVLLRDFDLRFGVDFRRPGSSLRLVPHFPTEYRLILDDLEAIFAYLQTIPAVENPVPIVP